MYVIRLYIMRTCVSEFVCSIRRSVHRYRKYRFVLCTIFNIMQCTSMIITFYIGTQNWRGIRANLEGGVTGLEFPAVLFFS